VCFDFVCFDEHTFLGFRNSRQDANWSVVIEVVLGPDLKIGTTFAILKSDGMTLDLSEQLIM